MVWQLRLFADGLVGAGLYELYHAHRAPEACFSRCCSPEFTSANISECTPEPCAALVDLASTTVEPGSATAEPSVLRCSN